MTEDIDHKVDITKTMVLIPEKTYRSQDKIPTKKTMKAQFLWLSKQKLDKI